ncbi:LysR family transcriptional regulator [Aliidiomarina soli]|uniref:LysR family transcriptional regulator n=1 Tax=Aliidiomarina soli TaxID=1928574 RepID=A0A432WC35_9GAMM|nr:LysR family transcriptional regulator [Aliidiomarina soli]RUO29618.1 LysR family transcriptional regulator [Aliidiomarina soli]
MTIWQLQVFKAIVDDGSLQLAAARLHRTPPALSMTLSKLEQELGFSLFTREGYRLRLTPRGKQFTRHSYELLRQHAKLESFSALLASGAEAELELAFDATCNANLLTPALQLVQQQFAGTECIVNGYSQLNALKMVQDNQVALALTPWLPVFQQRADFESLYVCEFELTVVIARDLVPGTERPTRELLNTLPYVLPQKMDMGIDPEQIYRVGGVARLRVNDVSTLLTFIKAGMGWGIVPRQLVADSIAEGELVELNIDGFLDRIRAEVHLVKLASTVLGPAGQVVWDYFRQFERK